MILTLLTPAPAWARSPLSNLQPAYLAAAAPSALTGQLSSFSGHSPLHSLRQLPHSIFFYLRSATWLLLSKLHLVAGDWRLCASPVLQFWRPITGEEAELLSDPRGVVR
ncbi:unnamed protein product [Staurois parvus]|uniref:Secreted protein n=1 Tax=Staurois parvus TaxID=386267 RepID=A0ABN9CEX7_9NEOB|nr:unnamed protein product [Staurois parvus]